MNQAFLNTFEHIQHHSSRSHSYKSAIELQKSISVNSEDQDNLFSEFKKQEASHPYAISLASKKIQKAHRHSKKELEGDTDSPSDSSKKQRQTWKPDEDAQVIELVLKYGQRWKKISDLMGRRTAKQIRDRYLHKLRPNIERTPWTVEEDHLLLTLHEKYGAKWSQIVQQMPTRTENQVRNRYNSRLKYGFYDGYKVSSDTASSLASVSPTFGSRSDSTVQNFTEEKSSLASIKYSEEPVMDKTDLFTDDIESFFAKTKEDFEKDYQNCHINQLINSSLAFDSNDFFS